MSDTNNKVTIDLNTLAKKANTIREETEYIERQITLLKKEIGEFSTFWQGEAASAFINSFNIEIEKVDNFLALAEKLSKDYKFASEQYNTFQNMSDEVISAIDD